MNATRTCQGFLPYPNGADCNAQLAEGAGDFCPACLERGRKERLADMAHEALRQHDLDAAWDRFNRVGPLEFGNAIDERNDTLMAGTGRTVLTGTRLGV